MSYLPRMSKTYKEPEEKPKEIEEEYSSGSLKPASSLLSEKSFNPQTALKHYRYVPHAPPVLPGPSVLEEILENELLKEASRLKRSTKDCKDTVTLEPCLETSNSAVEENESKPEAPEKTKRRKGFKGGKNSLGRRRGVKSVKKEMSSNITINTCLTAVEKPFTATGTQRKSQSMIGDSEFLEGNLRREKSALPIFMESAPIKTEKPAIKLEIPEEKPEEKKMANRSVQCTIFQSPSKVFAIPQIVHSLLRTLTFLLHEIKKVVTSLPEEKKLLVGQIRSILNDLSSQKADKDFGFDVTYSDFKRLERISGELQKYLKDIYGDKREYNDKMEDLKKVYIESKAKEMEFNILMEKLQEKEEKPNEEVEVKEEDMKYPEITLQNKRLESEQLIAEVEFGNREILKYQKAIAELEWDVRSCQEQIASLKKSAHSKSKSEALTKKSSVHKFFSDLNTKMIKTKDSENIKKKT